jgi:hypothetical protein
MALEFETEAQAIERSQQEGGGARYKIPERLFKTKDGEVVLEDDSEANSLFKRAGDTIPMAEAIELGLVTKEEPVKEKSAAKQADKPKDKKAPASKNKGRGGK